MNNRSRTITLIAGFIIVLCGVLLSCSVQASAAKPIPRDSLPDFKCKVVKHPQRFTKNHPNAILFKGALFCKSVAR